MKKAVRLLAAVLAVCAIGSVLAVSASAAEGLAYGAATVDTTEKGSFLNIRSSPDNSNGRSDNIITMIGDKSILVILEKTSSDWYYINYEGTIGYVKTDYLTEILTKENFSATGQITGTDVRLRKKPATDADVLGTYNTGDTLAVIGINEGWYKVKDSGKTGYIRSDLMTIISSYNPTKATKSGAPAPSKTGNELVDYALQYVGYEYQYGGMSPKTGFDCSGFTSYVFKHFGVTLTRNSAGQYKNDGTKISKDELAPGDLLYFGSGKTVNHVGIYMGDDEFVHASGERVGVVISRLDSTYYIKHYIGAKRVSF